jgi:ATP synthase protein I
VDIAASQVQLNARKVIGLQIAIATLAAAVFGIVEGSMHAISAFFGGMISVGVSLLLRRGVLKAAEVAKDDPSKSMLVLYMGAVQRFVLVLALFGLGLGLLKLDPLATVIGFGVAQVAYVVVMRIAAHPAKSKT